MTLLDRKGWRLLGTASLLMGALMSSSLAQADIEIVLDVEAQQLLLGERSLARITIANSGTSAEADLSVNLAYPNGLDTIFESELSTFFDSSASCTAVGSTNTCGPGDPLIWDLGDLNPGEAIQLTLPVVASADLGLAGSNVDLSASVVQSASVLASADAQLSLGESRPLSVSIDPNQNPVALSGELAYAISYANQAPTSVTNATLEFTLPANTSLVSASGSASESGGVVTWDLGTLAAGSVAQQSLVVSLDGGLVAGNLLTATASIDGVNNSLPTEQGLTDTIYLGNGPALDVAVSLGANPVAVDSSNLIEIFVSNPTAELVFDTVVEMRYSTVAEPVFETAADEQFDADSSCANTGSNNLCSSGDVLRWPLGVLAPGQTRRLSVQYPIDSSQSSGVLGNWEAVATAGSGLFRSASQTLAVRANDALTLAVDNSAAPVAAGDSLSYRLSYGNVASTSVADSILTFAIPANLSVISATGNASVNGDQISWSLGTLPSGSVGEQSVELAVSTAVNAGDLFQASALITGTNDALPNEARATDVDHIGEGSPLDINVELQPALLANQGQSLITVEVSNPSDALVLGAVLRTRIPAGAEGVFEPVFNDGFDVNLSCNNIGSINLCGPGDQLFWNLGNLPPGQNLTVTLPVTVDAPAGSQLNWAFDVFDDSAILRSSGDTLSVVVDSPLTLTLSDQSDPIAADSTFAYVLRYGNASDTEVDNTNLVLQVPENLDFVSASGGGQMIDGSVVWSLATLPAGLIGQQSAVFTVADGLTEGEQLFANAQISGVNSALATSQRSAEATVVGSGTELVTTLTISPNPILPGGTSTIAIEVTNPSVSLVSNVQVSLRIPPFTSSFFETVITGPVDLTASCNGVSSINLCPPGDTIIWELGNLEPGQVVELTLPAQIEAVLAQGLQSLWEVTTRDESGTQQRLTESLQVGEFGDAGPLGSAILPVSRSVQVGQTATAFATLINAGAIPAIDCTIAPASAIDAVFSFQATDPTTNATIGLAGVPVDVDANGTQSFVFSLTPNAVVAPTDLALNFDCANTDPAPVFAGLNTLLFSAEANPIPDIIGLTTTTDFLLSSGTPGAFAVGSANVGTTGVVTVSLDTGTVDLPLSLNLCLTDPQSGLCVSEIAAAQDFTFEGGGTASLAVFVTATENIANNPAVNRIFIRFTDASGVVRGATSTAVRTQ